MCLQILLWWNISQPVSLPFIYNVKGHKVLQKALIDSDQSSEIQNPAFRNETDMPLLMGSHVQDIQAVQLPADMRCFTS